MGIRINSIQSGAVSSEIMDHAARLFAEGDTEKLNASFLHMIPLNRIGTPTEIGNLAAFLLSDSASYITGTSIPADGGMLARLV
jgi:glucose 1-dehydrogenase